MHIETVEEDRPPCAGRDRPRARRAAARGGGRGTTRPSRGRSRGSRSGGRAPRRRRAQASPSRSISARASPTTYSAFRRENPTATSSSSLAAAIRSPGGERVRVLARLAEALDQPVADRERGEQRDLLRRDRRDEALERVGRKRRAEPGEARHELVEHRLPGGPGPERLELELSPEQLLDDRSRFAGSSGSTSTPPGAASIRTSRPPTTRWRPPSCQRFARSAPKARKRSVESSKSYGSGKRSSNVVEGLERLVGHPEPVQVGGEQVTREDTVGGKRGAPVGDAVADVDERTAPPAASDACTCRRTPGTSPRRGNAGASRRAAGRRRCSEPRP